MGTSFPGRADGGYLRQPPAADHGSPARSRPARSDPYGRESAATGCDAYARDPARPQRGRAGIARTRFPVAIGFESIIFGHPTGPDERRQEVDEEDPGPFPDQAPRAGEPNHWPDALHLAPGSQHVLRQVS